MKDKRKGRSPPFSQPQSEAPLATFSVSFASLALSPLLFLVCQGCMRVNGRVCGAGTCLLQRAECGRCHLRQTIHDSEELEMLGESSESETDGGPQTEEGNTRNTTHTQTHLRVPTCTHVCTHIHKHPTLVWLI